MFLAALFGQSTLASEKNTYTAELDAFWQKISRAVETGDLQSYRDTCHPDAVIVSGIKKSSSPLAAVLKRWKQEFDDTRAGKIKARVEFRFSHRYSDASTAHEKGMFLYSSQKKGEQWKREYIHFEGLLTKKEGRWLMMMEYQKSVGTQAEWEKLAR